MIHFSTLWDMRNEFCINSLCDENIDFDIFLFISTWKENVDIQCRKFCLHFFLHKYSVSYQKNEEKETVRMQTYKLLLFVLAVTWACNSITNKYINVFLESNLSMATEPMDVDISVSETFRVKAFPHLKFQIFISIISIIL